MDVFFSVDIPFSMGIPMSSSEIVVTKLILYSLSFLGFIQQLILRLFGYLGLTNFIEPDVLWSISTAHQPKFNSLTSMLIKDNLPVVRFKDLQLDGTSKGCAVCLDEFDSREEIRRLVNCQHLFHRKCLDPWIDNGRKTCPLCRTPLIVREMEKSFKPLGLDY